MAPDASAVAPLEAVEPKKPHVHVDIIDGSETMVVLLGWAGCRQRYLSKYAEYYQKQGMSTVCYTAPIAKIRSFASYTSFADYFLRESTHVRQHEKVFYHVFSMNGCSLLTALWDVLDGRDEAKVFQAPVKGLLFDSSPAYTTPSQSANAISFATLPPSHYNPALRNSYRALLFTFFAMHRGLLWLKSFVDSSIYEKEFAYFRLLNIINSMPKEHLYLYGPGDEVCSEESIEEFAKTSEEHGINVTRVNMKDSLHCQHYRTYPDLYRQACIDFINKISANDSSK